MLLRDKIKFFYEKHQYEISNIINAIKHLANPWWLLSFMIDLPLLGDPFQMELNGCLGDAAFFDLSYDLLVLHVRHILTVQLSEGRKDESEFP